MYPDFVIKERTKNNLCYLNIGITNSVPIAKSAINVAMQNQQNLLNNQEIIERRNPKSSKLWSHVFTFSENYLKLFI